MENISEENIVITENTLIKKQTKKSKKIVVIAFSIFIFLYAIIMIGYSMFVTMYDTASVSGLSMYPTINAQWNESIVDSSDIVYYSQTNNYNKGDIIIAKNPTNEMIIKRLIAVAGDEIKFKEVEDKLCMFVNNEAISETYLSNENQIIETSNKIFGSFLTLGLKALYPEDFVEDDYGDTIYKVPENSIFFLGDNRLNSNDCSSYGALSKDNLIAKVFVIQRKSDNMNFIEWFFYRSYYGYVVGLDKLF